MRTQILRTAAIAGLALGVGFATGAPASAQSVTTDEAAAYVVFPRIGSDAKDIFRLFFYLYGDYRDLHGHPAHQYGG